MVRHETEDLDTHATNGHVAGIISRTGSGKDVRLRSLWTPGRCAQTSDTDCRLSTAAKMRSRWLGPMTPKDREFW
jgi:ABC-type hemin transport system ATPase subunit